MEVITESGSSGKSCSVRRTSVVDFSDSTVESEKQEVPIHLFVSPAHSDGGLSSCSRRRRRKAVEETSFSLAAPNRKNDSTRSSLDTIERFDESESPVTKPESEHRKSFCDEMKKESYRDRIRDRFNIVKERAVESLSRPQSRSQSRLKMLLIKQTGNRMEEIMKKEEEEVSAAMTRHESVKLMWRQACKEALSESELDFFEDDPAEEEDPAEEAPPSDSEKENGKVLTSDFLGIRDEWEMCEFREAEQWMPSMKELLMYPTTKPVPLVEKLEPGMNPRYLEEEGLFVGKKIPVSYRVRNKMEHRLLMDPDGRKWFELDGEFISSTDPVSSVRLRQPEREGKQALTVFQPATLHDVRHRYVDITGSMHYVLDLDISVVQFTHHPLFSREHVLAQRLKELFGKYKRRREMDPVARCKGRLDALRKARKNATVAVGQDNEAILRFEEDIREVRQLRNMEGFADKELVGKILTTWKDLKQLRESQQYQNTSLQLIVTETAVDAEEEERLWEEEIKAEAKEIFEELKRKYDREVALYEEVGQTPETENSDSDQEKPEPPRAPSFANVRKDVAEAFRKSFPGPGDPRVELSITYQEVEPCQELDNKENQRRSAVKRDQIYLKLFYNGKEVCRSRSRPLTHKFKVIISQRFAIRILEWPESLMIEIHNSGFAGNPLVPAIYLPFPNSLTTVDHSDFQKHEFSSENSITFGHAGIGSGCNIVPYPEGSAYNGQPICLYTAGTIAYRIGWAEVRGQILSPPEIFCSVEREEIAPEILAGHGIFDVAKLKEWARKSKLDPNDPHNSFFLHYLRQFRECENLVSEHFRLDPLLHEFDFCHDDAIDDNPRLKLLHLRSSGEPEFRSVKMVPLTEKQIHKDVFKMYEKRVSNPQHSVEVMSSDPLDGHRAWGKKYLEKVRQNVLKEFRLARQHKKFKEVVSEESVPDLGTLGLTFMKWLQPKRPLRPVRKERKRIPPQNLTGQEVKIIVNVVRAFEVPVRKDVDCLSTSGSIDGFSLVNVRPFVEISFRGRSARTTAADGANPTWNQDLQIPLGNGDFSSASLQAIKDSLYLHLFDEIVVDLIEDETQRETNIHQRFERNWLASMEIPFSTLYFNSRIEGTFKLYSPPVLLGYEREAHRRQFSGSTGEESLLPQRDATYITLFVTVQPPLNPPDPIKEKLESREVSAMEKHLEGWQKEVTDMYPLRKVKTLVTDVTGKTVCITRFVKRLTPPRIGGDDEEVTPEMAARFVALIPSVAGSIFFPGLFDIWLTGDQVLRLLSGDSEAHALLLCSYFLELGMKAYVLLGAGIPHGSTAYVLVKEGPETTGVNYIWDATNGQKYNIKDSFCPLQKIYCVFNDENIWANIQQEEAPRRTKFDLTRRSEWFPAFGKNIRAPSGTVQPDTLEYLPTSRQAVDILQDKMEKRLRDNIMKWRKKKRTHWNRYCSGTLRKLLPKLEESTWNVREEWTPDHAFELQHILASHKMCGFPINMAYTDMDAVVEAVKATGVHCHEGDAVEFALSVYIHGYPNDVLSVWIYVASLFRRR